MMPFKCGCGNECPYEMMYQISFDDHIVEVCPMCYDNFKEAEEENPSMMQVTREMAKDAGDLSLEGTWISW